MKAKNFFRSLHLHKRLIVIYIFVATAVFEQTVQLIHLLLDGIWYGAALRCLTPLPIRNDLNSSAINCGPLSVTTQSGRPCVANTWHNASIVFTAVVLAISMTCGHFENASTRTKYVCSEMVQQNLYVALTTVYLAMARDLMVL